MELAISGETLGSELELTEILQIIKQNGVNAIEIWPENIPVEKGKELMHKRLYANRDINKAKEILDREKVKAVCVCFGAGFDKELAKDRKMFSDELLRAVETAHVLGAKIVNHYCYYLAMEEDFRIEELRDIYKPALQAAEKYGIYLALENEAHDITKNPMKMKEIIEMMDSANFRTNYDAANYYQAGYEGFPYCYEVLKDIIVHVHIKNVCIFHPEFGHQEVLKGGGMTGKLLGESVYYPIACDGAVNVDGMIRRLIKDGYAGYCSLEPHTSPKVCIEYYKAETEYLHQRGF